MKPKLLQSIWVLPVLLLIGFIAGYHRSIFLPYSDHLELVNLSIIDEASLEVGGSRALGEVAASEDDRSPSFDAIKILFETLPTTDTLSAKPTIVKNFLRRQRILPKEDVVLATQASTNKYSNLKQQLKYWNGPASVAIYIKSQDGIDAFFKFTHDNQEILLETSFHVVMEKTDMLYPTNILRNVALEAIESDYFVAMDVDLIPLPMNCYETMSKTMQRLQDPSLRNTLFVLPAFSLLRQEGELFADPKRLPLSRPEAVVMERNHTLEQFWKTGFPSGHGFTDYDKWSNGKKNGPEDYYEISLQNGPSKLYEPYVLGYKPGIPRYWEDFRGFHKNKISFFTECYNAGYEYKVLYDFYCVHLDHPDHSRKSKIAQRKTNQEIWDKFNSDYLVHKYDPRRKNKNKQGM